MEMWEIDISVLVSVKESILLPAHVVPVNIHPIVFVGGTMKWTFLMILSLVGIFELVGRTIMLVISILALFIPLIIISDERRLDLLFTVQCWNLVGDLARKWS